MGTAETYQQITKKMDGPWRVRPEAGNRVGMLQEILRWMGHPESKLRVIHIVGTNGKGSTGVMLAKILVTAGYKVGHFSTPAILNDREVITTNGDMISEADFVSSYKRVLEEVTAHGGDEDTLSKFEWWTLVALDYFARKEMDFVILEAGVGGLRDATNVIEKPLVVAFTKISYDHVGLLGNDLLEIAQDKAGAIKPGASIVNYPGQDIEVYHLLHDKAEEVGAIWNPNPKPVITIVQSSPSGLVLNADQFEGLKLSLTGAYQANNLSTVLQIVTVLKSRGFEIKDVDVAEALAHVKIQGRMEFDAERNILYDGAHNPDGIISLVASIRSWHLPFKPVVVLGLLKGKNYHDMLEELLPHVDTVIAVTPDSDRAMSADELAAKIVMMSNVDVEIADDPSAAITLARRVRESSEALILVTGSFYTLRAIESEGM
ncbi:bifunctional folylpolyglutamate synthase/dihydrofolate synthase [Weissella confusa]|jgi:dihydrofolate synthase/folylpolyglutamate synthase|uniref:tetrahydrofolate synthase n=1 Tax=Weissella confusa TaxID=1583 RepID=A0A0R2FAT8_WEICO|nr:Mur ligase family protein [Weissella confusa]KRN22442.1 folylpolyglutamate synthase [Weissella confusa]MBD1490933.1 tetrahydrofolate synthase [Weissella confusa]MBF7058166.1 tetrahydrofolate synthase [Weissella confusa]MBJ7617289.1 tetrahydrofolate synthase [Weissella confusa]MBJ7621834.1 tetrahydrofolate synthase [Weissella confusa]